MTNTKIPTPDVAGGAVLFDIDGTLIDSNYLHVEAWAHAFFDLGLNIDQWRIHRSIGMDSGKLLGALLGDDRDKFGDEAKKLHTRYYGDMQPRLRPFLHARELLKELENHGLTIVLATSAPDDELKMLREILDVEESVARVTSGGEVETAKPEPDIVNLAVKKAGTPARTTMMVGDSTWDVTAARRAGVACIGVLSGGVSGAELRDAGAVAVFDDVSQLRDQLLDSPLSQLWQHNP